MQGRRVLKKRTACMVGRRAVCSRGCRVQREHLPRPCATGLLSWPGGNWGVLHQDQSSRESDNWGAASGQPLGEP